MVLALHEIEGAALEGLHRRGVGQRGHHLGRGDAPELGEECRAPLAYQPPQLSAVIGEIVKGRGGGELLPLEEHGGGGSEEQIGGEGTIAPRARELVETAPMGGVGDLVVVLEKAHEPLGRKVESGSTAATALPLVALTLVEKGPVGRRDELLGRAAVVGVVALG